MENHFPGRDTEASRRGDAVRAHTQPEGPEAFYPPVGSISECGLVQSVLSLLWTRLEDIQTMSRLEDRQTMSCTLLGWDSGEQGHG